MKSKHRIPEELQRWIEARRRFNLSHAQVQMARELGLNPRKMGGMANHRQEPWKVPLPQFIEHLYRKRFGKSLPDRVVSIEDRAREVAEKRAERSERRRLARAQAHHPPSPLRGIAKGWGGRWGRRVAGWTRTSWRS